MDNYHWTNHSLYKMKRYGLSQQRVKRVIRAPERTEEGIVPKTIAVMQPNNSKHTSEMWVMYQLRGGAISKSQKPISKQIPNYANRKIRIISAWRYPGKSPKQNPIPQEILDEIKRLL
jgi:hypothetical protein